MESIVEPESTNVGIRKRELEHEESESRAARSRRASGSRKRKRPEYLSSYCDSSSDEDNFSKLSTEEKKTHPSSKWNYDDLKFLNILYNEKPEPFDDFVKEIKKSYNCTNECPDSSKMVRSATEFLKENLTFSFDLNKMKEILFNYADPVDIKALVKKEREDLTEDIKRTLENALKLDQTNIFNTTWRTAVPDFIRGILELIDDLLLQRPAEIARKHSKKKKPGNHREEAIHYEAHFQSHCENFIEIFFLRKGCIPLQPLTYNNKTVKSNPDIIYPAKLEYTSSTPTDPADLKKNILFVVEVKKNPLNNDDPYASLEEQIGPSVMGQVGSELLLGSLNSVFLPNSLGLICMETKLIVVFLKQSKEHFNSVFRTKSVVGEGNISYSQPFDMLNAEDRVKIAELLFWLGCIQDPYRYRDL